MNWRLSSRFQGNEVFNEVSHACGYLIEHTKGIGPPPWNHRRPGMFVNVAVLKETQSHERRVALVPSVTARLIKLGAKLHMQSGPASKANSRTIRSRT